MRSKFSIAGHPLHPMLVALPIGLFAWALAADIVYLARDHEHYWYSISMWSGIAAIITALLAALFGFGDYFTMARKTQDAAVATAHMVLNLIVVVLYFVAMLLMLGDNATGGGQLGAVVVLHAVGLGLLALSGWLGGEMVYKGHLAVVPDTEALEREEHVQHDLGPTHPSRNPFRSHPQPR